MNNPRPQRPGIPPATRVLIFLVCWILTTALCVAFVDRPAATWSHAVLHGIPVFDPLTHLVDPLQGVAAAGLACAALAALAFRWRPGESGRTLLAAGLAIIVSVALKEQLKFVFGRTWPETWVAHNPSWIANGAYGFNFLHGGQGWASFPSGHMTQICALATILWARVRPLRWLWAAMVVLVAAGLFGCDYHFVGDMVAGAYLGAGTAIGILAFLRNGDDRDAPGERSAGK